MSLFRRKIENIDAMQPQKNIEGVSQPSPPVVDSQRQTTNEEMFKRLENKFQNKQKITITIETDLVYHYLLALNFEADCVEHGSDHISITRSVEEIEELEKEVETKEKK